MPNQHRLVARLKTIIEDNANLLGRIQLTGSSSLVGRQTTAANCA
ncbi:MAG: hypothetical protein ACI9OF_000443 [Saprospiraceae bacterium]